MNKSTQAGMNEMVLYMESLDNGVDISTMIKELSRYIEKEVVGTGKNFKVDMYALAETGLLKFEQLASFENGLNTELAIGNKVVTNKESKYVLVVQCKMKLNTLNNLNKLQSLVYELYRSNPEVARLGLAKMTTEERATMDVVLTYDR